MPAHSSTFRLRQMVGLSSFINMIIGIVVFAIPLVVLGNMLDRTFFRVQTNYNFWVFHAVLFLLAWNASMFGILGCISHDYKVEFGYLITQIFFLFLSLISGLGTTILTWSSTAAVLAKQCRKEGQDNALCDNIAQGGHQPTMLFKVMMIVPLVLYWICSVWVIITVKRYVQVLKQEIADAAAKAAAKKGGSKA